MTEDILINVTPFETRVALVARGAVQELHMERSTQRGQVASIPRPSRPLVASAEFLPGKIVNNYTQ